MLKVAAKAAISGLILGGAIGGISAALSGGSVWKGILEGAVYGALDGAALAVVIFGIVTAVKAIAASVRAANAARAARSAQVADTVSAQKVVQPATERVGRWMSKGEYDEMVRTGMVQEGAGGVTYVSRPADMASYVKQAKPGSLYVEFDVSVSSLRNTQAGWAKIIGPNSIDARYMISKGLMPPTSMPRAFNINLVMFK